MDVVKQTNEGVNVELNFFYYEFICFERIITTIVKTFFMDVFHLFNPYMQSRYLFSPQGLMKYIERRKIFLES